MSIRTTSTSTGGSRPRLPPPGKARRLRRLFDVGAWFKGLEGAVEIAAGAWLALDPAAVESILFRLAAKDLLHDPHDRIASALRHVAQGLDASASFPVVYLVAHGVIKVALAIGLLRDYRPAYPAAVVALGALASYQLYRFSHTHAVTLPVLSAIDLGIAWLVWREWGLRKLERAPPPRR